MRNLIDTVIELAYASLLWAKDTIEEFLMPIGV